MTFVTIINRYGTTEAPSTFIFNLVDYSEKNHGAFVPIGKPISQTRFQLFESKDNANYQKNDGELFIGGTQVALGYFKQPVLTQEKFYLEDISGLNFRFYKTGDIAKLAVDGNLVYIGRQDNQIDLRGHRIDPEEVEEALGQHHNIKHCAIVPYGEGINKRLIAYFIPVNKAENPSINFQNVKEHLWSLLPDYMIPSEFICIDALPHLPNGKLDRKALKEQISNNNRLSLESDNIETQILSIFESILPGRLISLDNSFIDIGGHSLLGVVFIVEVRKQIGVNLSLADLFQYRSLQSLAFEIASRKSQTIFQQYIPSLCHTHQPCKAEMSFGQKLLWRLYKSLGQESVLYNDVWAIELSGFLDLKILGLALLDLIKRHEVFRMAFVDTEREEFILQEHKQNFLVVENALGLQTHERQTKIDAAVRRERNLPFNLYCELLIRANLIKFEEQESVLILSTHHITEDAWSGKIINRDLSYFYNIHLRGQKPNLPELTLNFRDFAYWQNSCVNSGVFDEELTYWRTALAKAPFNRKILHSRVLLPKISDDEAGLEKVIIPTKYLFQLKKITLYTHSTFFITLLAIFFISLHLYTNETDIIVGTAIAHRHYQNVQELVGFLPNMLLFRQQCSSNYSFLEFLNSVRTMALTAYKHQDIPFLYICDSLGIFTGAEHPAVSVTFHMPGENIRVGESLTFSGITSRLLSETDNHVKAKFDLSLAAIEKSDELLLQFYYKKSVIEKQTIKELCNIFNKIIDSICKDSTQLICTLLT